MSRMSVAALTTLPEDSDYLKRVEAAADESNLSFTAFSGTHEEILEAAEKWTVLPELIIYDVPAEIDVFDALEALMSRAPEGFGDVVLTSVPNDIKTYRELKRMGVSEVFPSEQTQEELSVVVNEIAMRELKKTDIDPRRAVYVWGASGGSGGTSVALSFAKHLSKSGLRTLLIDLDLYSAPASYLFAAKEGAQETYGLVEALKNPARIDAIFLERAIQKVDKTLFYLSSRKKMNDRDFDPTALSVLIARAQKNFDVVVVDKPWRGDPETDWGKVNGISYIVAAPTSTSYLGFTMIAKELASTPSKAPVYGVINKAGEFKSNDISRKMFAEVAEGEVFEIPYDPAATGKMFFAQKTLNDLGGKIAKPLSSLLATLPDKTVSAPVAGKVQLEPRSKGSQHPGLLGRLLGGKK